jgi:enamine deaminase RidA (YjgF/YER057c/UK114 family)
MQDRKAHNIEGFTDETKSAAVSAGGLIFVSAQTGAGLDGKLAGPDVTSQTTRALERLGTVLAAAGSSLAQAVSVHAYIKRATDFETMNAAYRSVLAEKQPVRTTVSTDLPGGALIAFSAIAVPAGAPREILQPAGWMKSPRPYSFVIRAGGFVFLSGLVSRRGTDDQIVPGPVTVQTKQILDNAGVLLKTAGLRYDDVVASRVFLTDESLFDDMNNTYRTYFLTDPPARATAIAPLMGSENLVEITLIASTVGKQVLGPAVSPSLPLSTAVRAGDLLFLSGVLGNTDATANDLIAQSREILTRIKRTLDTAGVSFNHIVENTVYLTDVWQQKKVDDVTRTVFPADPPARTVIGTGLVTRAGLVEMMMTASGR